MFGCQVLFCSHFHSQWIGNKGCAINDKYREYIIFNEGLLYLVYVLLCVHYMPTSYHHSASSNSSPTAVSTWREHWHTIWGRLQETGVTKYALLTAGYAGVTFPLNAGGILYPGSYLKWIVNWMIKCMLIWMYLPGFIYGHVWPRIRVFLRACRECSLRTEFGSDPHSVVMAHEEKWVCMFNQIHHVGY